VVRGDEQRFRPRIARELGHDVGDRRAKSIRRTAESASDLRLIATLLK
jgi:hypothetical protein